MRVQAAAREAVEERLADQLHEARAYDQVRPVSPAVVRERLIPRFAGAELLDPQNEGGDARRGRPDQAADAVAVGADRDDPRPVARVRARVDQGLKVRPLPRDEHYQPRVHGRHLNLYGKIDGDGQIHRSAADNATPARATATWTTLPQARRPRATA